LSPGHTFAVFAMMCATDVVYARYTWHAAQRNPLRAGLFAVAIILCTGFVTTSYVANHWALIPAACGAFVGTFTAVKWGGK